MEMKSGQNKNKRSRSELEEEEDEEEENETGRFVCETCKKVVFCTKSLRKHKAKDHPRIKFLNRGRVQLTCDICNTKITKTYDRKTQDVHDHLTRIVCPLCQKLMYGDDLVKKSKLNAVVSKIEEDIDRMKTNYNKVCDKCGRVFTSANSYGIHMKAHETEPVKCLFACDQCTETVPTVTDLVEHYKTHEGCKLKRNKDLKCEYCDKLFSKAKKYIKHVKNHRNESCDDDGDVGDDAPVPLGCTQYRCVEIYYDVNLYKLHQYRHIYLLYPCEVCGRNFKMVKTLVKHKRHFHTTEDNESEH